MKKYQYTIAFLIERRREESKFTKGVTQSINWKEQIVQATEMSCSTI